jgi:PAS domain S-box-containing protein
MAFERSANPMVLLTFDRALVAANKAFEEAFGYAPGEVAGRPADLFIAPSAWKRVETDWARLRRTGRLTVERELLRADGRLVRVKFAAQREVITGRQLVLAVALDMRMRPITLQPANGDSPKALTPRELEIVGEIAMGRRGHEIASDLLITPATVKTHVRNAMRKVGARSQAQLVAITLATGMLDPATIDRALFA